jgi:hypothetical protein
MRTDIWRPLSIALVCVSLLAQQQPQQPTQQPPDAKFETTAQLVVLDVNVTDKSGKPIEGLTAKDFTVAEDGVPQTIKFCEPQKMLDTATPPQVSAAPAKPLDSGRAKVDPVTSIQIAMNRPAISATGIAACSCSISTWAQCRRPTSCARRAQPSLSSLRTCSGLI